MRLAVCVPTYEESENLPRLVEELARVFAEHALDARLLVIDDNSPDGTGAVADALAREHPFVDVLHRARKQGLGPAYLAGFRAALAGGADVVLQMDADLSHDPADVPRLLAAIGHGADVAVGSRYVAGGAVRNWGPVRRAVSRFGSLYARLVLGVRVRDLTSGFKCYTREVLEAIETERIHSVGYAFQIETTYRALAAGFRVVEVPIVFLDRQRGGSKMSRRIVLEAAVRVPALRLAAARGRL